MQENSFHSKNFGPSSTTNNTHSSNATAGQVPSQLGGQLSVDELTRIFNTAVIGTRVEATRDFSAELYSVIETPAFKTILNSIRQHARLNGSSDKSAAEEIIQTFRKIDQIWSEYLVREGLDRLKRQMGT